jgi:hypothetical protein
MQTLRDTGQEKKGSSRPIGSPCVLTGGLPHVSYIDLGCMQSRSGIGFQDEPEIVHRSEQQNNCNYRPATHIISTGRS